MGTHIGLLLLALSTIPALAAAQEITGTLRVEVSLVTVGVRVTDGFGREVTDLDVSNFRVYEDGVAQPIAFFSAEEQPISAGILLDRSDSMLGTKFDLAKSAAQLILGTLRSGSEYLYMPFDASWDSRAAFSDNRDSVKTRIAETTLGAGTAFYDAVVAAAQRCRTARNGRQVLVVITDGGDQHSSHSLDELVRTLQESQVQLYAIGYFSPQERNAFSTGVRSYSVLGFKIMDNPMLVFRRLAAETGAEAFFPKSDKELESAAEKIAKDLRTQYTIAYYPPAAASQNPRYRRVQVKIQGRTGLKVRARRGYIHRQH
jgi:Ca-activated chloride channel homolog